MTVPPSNTPAPTSTSLAPTISEPLLDNHLQNFKTYDEILIAVDHLKEEDEEGLEELYQSMNLLVRKNEPLFHQFLKTYLPSVEKTNLNRSLFLIHSLVNDTQSPVESIGLVLTTKSLQTKDPHPVQPKNLSVVKIYLLAESQKKASEWKDTSTGKSLLPLLFHVAKTEKDLALVRESTRLIGLVTATPEAYYRDILKARDPIERRAFFDLIQQR